MCTNTPSPPPLPNVSLPNVCSYRVLVSAPTFNFNVFNVNVFNAKFKFKVQSSTFKFNTHEPAAPSSP